MSAYIKFDGIDDGESKDKGHKNWSDLLAASQVVHKPGAGATGVARRRGSVVHEDIQCSKLLDAASLKISDSINKQKVFPKVEIHFTTSTNNAGREVYLAYELKNVMVTSYSMSGTDQGQPSEHFSLNFEEIKVKYTPIDEKGAKKGDVSYSWKVEEGEA